MTNNTENLCGVNARPGSQSTAAPNPVVPPHQLPNTGDEEAETESPETESPETETCSKLESFPELVAKETGKALAELLFARYFCKSVGGDGAMVGANPKFVYEDVASTTNKKSGLLNNGKPSDKIHLHLQKNGKIDLYKS